MCPQHTHPHGHSVNRRRHAVHTNVPQRVRASHGWACAEKPKSRHLILHMIMYRYIFRYGLHTWLAARVVACLVFVPCPVRAAYGPRSQSLPPGV
eukprot:2270101-Prymnesium_polylepis.2